VSRVSRTGVLNPSRVHLVYGSTGARGHVGVVFNHHGPHFFAHYCTLTRALTFSETSGVRACLVREDWRIERVAVAAQTLAVSVLVGGASTRRGTRVARGWTTKVGPRVQGVVRPIHREGVGARETLIRARRWPVIIAEALRDTNAALAIIDVDVPLITSIAVALAVSVPGGGASTRSRIRRRGWTLRVAVPIIRPPRGNGSGACVGVAVVNRILVV
jgi:hypothetical protein